MLFHKACRTVFGAVLLAGLIITLLQAEGVRAMRLFPPFEAPATFKRQPAALPAGQGDPLAKIEPGLLQELAAAGQSEFFVWMAAKADLNPAYRLKTKAEKGQFVFETLQQTAEASQKALRQELNRQQIRYQPFYIANKLLVFGGSQSLALTLAARPDVARITANHLYQLEKPMVNPNPAHIAAVEPNLTFINADDVWALGITGQNTVLAGNDTGLSWDHPALINHYRGWDGVVANHNYNWWDATDTYPTVPGDGHGHGTHTTGTMVGDDGGANRIGVAPGAKTIHCKNMTDFGGGTDATFTECFQWDLAPWDLSGTNPRPDLAPDAINNSWGYFTGNQPQFEDEIAALQAAGIVVEVSAGNEGPGCQSLRSPGDYRQSLTTGSVNHTGGSLPGLLTGFSSRGPSGLYPADHFPDIMAPGENIRSSLPGNTYASWSGTSMSGPHTTALVGLLWAANPALRGLVAETAQIIQTTAVPLAGQTGSDCGGDYSQGPNNDWGYGTIDAQAAVQEALSFGGVGTLTGVVSDGATPIAEATIKATLSPTMSWQTNSNALGVYSMAVLSGTHTVDASKYGYNPVQINAVSIMSGTTTTLDIILSPAAAYTVSGFVTDSTTGWPLYASLEIAGYPGGPIWNDPVTGYYSITLAAGVAYTFKVKAWAGGYDTISRLVGPLPGNQTEDFGLTANAITCSAPGYTPTPLYFENFENGLGDWTMTGLWNLENEADTCGVQVAPFPSSNHAAYYGLDDICTYDNGTANNGALTMTTPVTLPAWDEVTLSIHSYEETECGGDCFYDNRYIEISTDGGGAWTGLGEGNTEQVWGRRIFDLTAYRGHNVLIRFRFNSIDNVFNHYFGWMIDNVSIYNGCTPTSGGLVVGNVYDFNTGAPLNGAAVRNDSGQMTTTAPTPGDPATADGFYTLFSPAGQHVFTATLNSYGADVQTPAVIQTGVVWQDFNLPAGLLSFAPSGLEVTLGLGQSITLPFTLTNHGSLAATFKLQEVEGGYNLLSPPADVYTSNGAHHEPSTLSGWGKLSAPAVKRQLDTMPLVVNSLPVIINDPAGDAEGVDVTRVKATSTLSDMLMRLEFSPGDGPTGVVGYIHLDTDQNVATGLPPTTWYGLPAQDIGYDYYLYLFKPNSVDIYDANNLYIASVSPVYTADALEFSIPLSVLGDDDGLIDVTMVLGDSSAPTDWAPDVGHGSVSSGIPWLSEAPISGAIPSLAPQPIAITFDAGIPEVSQPGQYYGHLLIQANTPYTLPPVPVTMTITAPAGYGKLQGIVTGLAACDAPGAPLQDASIFLQSGLGFSQTLTTDSSGTYALWLDAAHTPLTAVISHAGYISQTVAAINLTAGLTTTQDIDLRLDAACLNIVPDELEVAVSLGLSTTLPLTLTNTGAGMATFALTETDQGFSLLGPTVRALGSQPTYAGINSDQVDKFLSRPTPSWQVAAADVLLIQDFAPWGYDSIEIILGDHNIFYNLINSSQIAATDFSPYRVIIIPSVQGSGYNINFNTNLAKFEDFIDAGGLLILNFCEQSNFIPYRAIPFGGDNNYEPDSYNYIVDPAHPIFAGVANPYSGNGANHNYLTNLLPGDRILVTAGTTPGGNVVMIERDHGVGMVVAGGQTFEYGWANGQGAGTILANMIPYYYFNWTGKDVPWLAEQPKNGDIAAGDVQVVEVIFDTDMVTQPGRYYASLRVVSNDLLDPSVDIPVTLTAINGVLKQWIYLPVVVKEGLKQQEK